MMTICGNICYWLIPKELHSSFLKLNKENAHQCSYDVCSKLQLTRGYCYFNTGQNSMP